MKREYTIQLDLSDQKIRSQFQALLGDFHKQAKKDAIQIELDWNTKSIADLKSKAEQIAKQFPEIGVQFKFEVNKKLLADLQKSYNEIWLYDDTSRAAQRIKDLFKELQDVTKQYKGISPDLIPKETTDRIAYLKEELASMALTLSSMTNGGKASAKSGATVFAELKRDTKGLEETLERINEEIDKTGEQYTAYPLINKANLKEYEAAKNHLEELNEQITIVKREMKGLEKQGAVDLTSQMDQATKDSKARAEIEAIKQALVELKQKAEQNISLQVQIKDAVDSINKVQSLLNELTQPKQIPIELSGIQEIKSAAKELKTSIESALSQVRVGFIGTSSGSGLNSSKIETADVRKGANLTKKQTEDYIRQVEKYLKTLKEQSSRILQPDYGNAQKKVDYYLEVSKAINIEKKSEKELTKVMQEQYEVYKELASARKRKKSIEYTNKDGNLITGIPSLDDVKAVKNKVAGIMAELAQVMKGKDVNLFEKLGKVSQDDEKNIKNLFNTYIDGANKVKQVQEDITTKNNNTKTSMNETRKSIEEIVTLFTGTSLNKKGLYEILDRFQNGEIELPKTIESIKELIALSSKTSATEVAVNNTQGVSAQLTKELTQSLVEQEQQQEELKQASINAGEAASESLEKTTQESKNTKKSIEELTEMIREMAKEAAQIGALTSPFGGYGGKAKGAWKKLSLMAETPEIDNYEVAKDIIEKSKLFTKTGDVDLLNAIKARGKDLTGESAESIQKWLTQAVDGYIRKLSRQIDDGVKESVETKLKIMGKKEYREYFKKHSIFSDPEEFERNFELELQRKLKEGTARQLISKSGKPGKWEIEVEAKVTKLDKLNEQFDKLKAITKEFKNFNLRDSKDREGITSIIEKFREYQSAGGKKTLEDLTSNSKALTKLTAEYEKQTEAAKANAEAKKENAKATDDATSKKAEEQAKDLTQSYKGLDDELQKLLADLPKLVTLFSGLINGTQNSVKAQDDVQKELKETTGAAQIAAKSVEELNKEFDILKKNKSTYDKSTLVGEYISYQQAGGTKKISELATRKVNTKALEEEYQKQMTALAQNNTVLNNVPSAKIQVEPVVLDPQKFADKVTALISKVFAKINISPGEILSPAKTQTIIKEIGQGIGDIVYEMIQADHLMSLSKSEGAGIRERAMYVNLLTGEHTNPFVSAGIHEFDLNEEVYKAVEQKVREAFNAYIHSHPSSNYAAMSIPQGPIGEEEFGDLFAFAYDYYFKNIKTQIIAAQNSVQVFDAERFYEDFNDSFGQIIKTYHDLGKKIREQSESTGSVSGELMQEFEEAKKKYLELASNIRENLTQISTQEIKNNFTKYASKIIEEGKKVGDLGTLDWSKSLKNLSGMFPSGAAIEESIKKLNQQIRLIASGGKWDASAFDDKNINENLSQKFYEWIQKKGEDVNLSFSKAIMKFLADSSLDFKKELKEFDSIASDGEVGRYISGLVLTLRDSFLEQFKSEIYSLRTDLSLKNTLGVDNFRENYTKLYTLDEFKKQYGGQIIQSIQDVSSGSNVAPNINPQEFINQLNELLKGYFVSVNVKPVINAEQVMPDINEALAGKIEGITGLDSLNKLINNLARNKDGRIDGVVQSLNNVREALNKNLGKNSLGQALKEIASQADGLKALSSIMKDYEKAIEVIQQAKANTPFDEDEKALLRAYDQAEEYAKNEKLIAKERAKGNAQAEAFAQERQKEAQEYEKWWLQALAAKEKAEARIEEQSQNRLQNQIEAMNDWFSIMQSNGKGKLVEGSLGQLKTDFDDFVSRLNTLSTGEAQSELDTLKNRAKQVEQAAKDIQKEMNAIAPAMKVEALKSKIDSILTFMKKLKPETRKELEGMFDALNPGTTTTSQLSDFKAKLDAINMSARQGGEYGTTFGQRWRRGLQSLARYLTTFASFYRIIGYIRQSFTTIKELDDALIDLRKTTTMTNEQLEEFYHNSANVGKTVGTTAKEIISQAAAWSRLGYQTKEEATAMAELSAQFAAISPGMTLDKATDGLVSTMKAFHIDVENVEQDVMDSINKIGNTMATSNEEVVEMLTRSSAAMSAANNTLAETIALESAAVQITRNAETTGTAFRTISMRIRGLDEETEEASEDFEVLQGKIADLTKTAKTPGGISLFTDKDKTTYKSTYQLLKEIASIYHDLTDKQQAGLLEALAGKRGGQVLAGLLDDFSEVEKAMAQISQSAGSADAEMQIIRESISYQLNALKQTWVGFLQDLIDRGVIQKLLENLTELSERLIEFSKNNPLAAIAGLMALIKAIKTLVAGNVIKNATVALSSFLEKIVLLKSGESISSVFFGPLTKSISEFTATANAATISTIGLNGAIKKLLASLIPFLPAIAAVVAVGAAFAYDEYIERKNEKIRQSAVEAADTLEQENNAVSNQIDRFEELRKKLRDSNLSEEEIYDTKKQLYDIQKDLNEEYGTEAGKLDLINGKYETQLELLQNISKEKTSQFIAENYEAYNNAQKVANQKRKYQISGGRLSLPEDRKDDDKKALERQFDDIIRRNIDPAYIKGVNLQEGVIDIRVDAKNAEDVFEQLFDNLEEFEEKTGLDLTKFKNEVSSQIKDFENDEELQQSLELIKQYNKAKIIDNDTLRPIYADAIKAVEEYNKALALYDGSEEAQQNIENTKAKLEEVRDAYFQNEDAVKEAQDVFGDVWEQINTTAEKKIELDKIFNVDEDELSNEIQHALRTIELEDLADYQLRDIDLGANLFEGNYVSAGFQELARVLGISQDEVDLLIDKLVELGYVEGEVAEKTDLLSDSLGFNKTKFSETMDEFENLQKLYNKFYEETSGKGTLKAPIDISEIEALREKWGEFDEFEHLEDLLSTTGSTAEDIQKSFDTLATQYTNTRIAVDEITDANKDLVASQMELDGITKESARDFTQFYADINKLKATEANGENILRDFTSQFMEGMGEGGTVDLMLRPKIDASELEQYGWEPGEGIATLFSSTFSNEDETIAMNFTPILTDGEGNAIGVLTPDELQAYAESVIAGGEDYYNLKIGATFEGQDAIDQAVDAAIQIHELQDVIYNTEDGFDLAIFADEANLAAFAEQCEVTTQALAAYVFQKQAANMAEIDTQSDAEDLYALAVQGNATKTVLEALSKLMNMLGEKEAAIQEFYRTGEITHLKKAQDLDWMIDEQMRIIEDAVNNQTAINPVEVPLTPTADTKSAGGAGKDAADAYVEAYEKELKELDALRDQGLISEGEYLNRLKALIDRFFKGRAEYAKKYIEEMKKYLDGMKSYYDSAISGVITLLDRRINAAQKSKEKAIKAIEEERDAAVGALEDQKKEIEKIIKEKQKQIKAIEKMKKPLEDEIDRINKANEARKQEIELQKDLYELERLQNQRTQFVYKDGQMVYQADPNAMRDARDKVKEDEDEQKIAKLEKQIEAYDKQIEAINEEIDLLQEQSDLIDEQIEALNEFYDKLIKEQEEYWDSIIEALEETKSKYEELAEVEKVAEAFGVVKEVFGELGYTVEEVLSGNEAAFSDFYDKYVSILAGLHSGDESYLAGLSEVTGKSVEELEKIAAKIRDIDTESNDNIENMGDAIKTAGEKAETASSGIGNYATKAGEAATNSKDLKDNTEGIATNLDGINSSISSINGQPIQDLIDKFESLRSKLVEVKNALGSTVTGSNGDQSLSGLAGTLQSLNTITFEGLIANFDSLLASIDAVTAALGGGGGGESTAPNNGLGAQSAGNNGQMTENSNNSSTGLTGAIEAVKTAADTYIGTGGDTSEGGEGEGTAIADFGAFKESVDNVSAAIGGENAPAGTGTDEREGGTLTDTLKDFAEVNHDVLVGGSNNYGLIVEWELFKAQLEESAGYIADMAQGLQDIDGHEYETTLIVHLEFDGDPVQEYTGTANGGHGSASFNVLEKLELPSEGGTFEAKYKHKPRYTGTATLSGGALAHGNWGLDKGGKTLVGELGPEIVIRGSKFWTVGDNGPEFVNLSKGDIILNHLQTREVLDSKNQVISLNQKGKALVNGTLPSNLTPLSQSNPEQFNQFMQTAELLKANTDSMKTDLSSIGYATDDIRQAVQNITNNSTHMGTNITFGDLQFTCTGVTSSEVITEVGNALQREFAGLALNAYQRAVNMA